MKRRQFLQFTGSFFATLGLNQLEIQQQGIRYARVLAQNTPRKLALLVGINQYPKSQRFGALAGCITDIDLQRELLIHRFGFNPKDILSLTDTQATREGILKAFESHLINQAKPGDVVVFHFSGHGSRVLDSNPIAPDGLNSTFVPADDTPLSQSNTVPDIMGQTLFLLMSALKTENVTVVLDCCHSGGGTRGNYRIRAAEGGIHLKPSEAELAYQNQWLEKLNLSRDAFTEKRRAGVAKGIVIAAAQRNQVARDVIFGDFYAGAFTYLMVQYLWQQPYTVSRLMTDIRREIYPLSVQVPFAEVKSSDLERKHPYFTEQQFLPADAVISSVSGNQAKVWLGGLDHESLAAFGEDAVFKSIDGAGEVKLLSRQGLIGTGVVRGSIQPKTLLQEAVRTIPSDLKLRIGIDASLGSETDIARKALSEIHRMEPVLPPSGNGTYAGEVHYILGRMTPTNQQQLQGSSDVPVAGSIGLFSPGLELIPNSFGNAGESVKAAIARLEPKLKAFLAARLIKLTLNGNSSQLDVEVALYQEGGNQLIGQAFTMRGGQGRNRDWVRDSSASSHRLPISAPFQFRVKNHESRPIYLSILVLQPDGEIIVLFPNQWRTDSETMKLEAGEFRLIPDPDQDDFQIVTLAKGMGEALVIASLYPLKKSLLALQSLAAELRREQGPIGSTIEAMDELLADLSSERDERGLGVQRRQFQVAEMMALSITFEVV